MIVRNAGVLSVHVFFAANASGIICIDLMAGVGDGAYWNQADAVSAVKGGGVWRF